MPRIIDLLKTNKEEAEFSKVLATIHMNVPIKFELPTKTVRENLDIHKITALWTELEFRTLPQRLKNLLDGKMTEEKKEKKIQLETLGEYLSEIRKSSKLALSVVSKQTSIKERYLEALEKGAK